MTLPLAVLVLVLGCGLLAWGADRFVLGASALARNFGVSPLVIGIVLVGFATSMPEILVSAIASYHGKPLLAMGNAVGSNVANIALVIGATAVLKPVVVQSNLLKREFPVLVGVMLGVYLLLLDGYWGRFEGVMLCGVFVALLAWMYWLTQRDKVDADPLAQELVEELPARLSNKVAAGWWLLGLVLLLVSSRMVVMGAVTIAKMLGVSDLVIGLTIVALGTSLPELAAAIVSNFKNEPDMVLGNVIGSNLFNIVAVMAMPALISPTPVPMTLVHRDFPIMIILTGLMVGFAVAPRMRATIGRMKGSVLLLAYVGYLVLVAG